MQEMREIKPEMAPGDLQPGQEEEITAVVAEAKTVETTSEMTGQPSVARVVVPEEATAAMTTPGTKNI